MTRLPTYLRQVPRNVKDVPAGEVIHVEIRHDDDCGTFKGRACDCEPEVESGQRVDRKYGGGVP